LPNLHVFGGLTIFLKICEDQTYRLALEAEKKLAMKIEEIWNEREERGFGNGRPMRNLFEQCLALQAKRIAGMSKVSKDDLIIFKSEDIPEIKANG